MKKNFSNKWVASTFFTILVPLATLSTPAHANVPVLSGRIDGTSYLTYDQEVWATMRSQSYRTDTHGTPINNGALEPTSNTFGNRFLYPQKFLANDVSSNLKPPAFASDARIIAGTSDPEAVAQWRLFLPEQHVPLNQPVGGWEMPIDSLQYGLDLGESWDTSYTPSSYDPDPGERVNYSISLGGSLRLASDFIAPSGVLWLNKLAIQNGDNDAWYITTLGIGGTIFELIDPKFGVNADGLMTLEADYKWGDTNWSHFFRFNDDSELNSKVLGHISFNPSLQNVPAVPVPSAVWLFGSALLGFLGLKRRPAAMMA